MVGWSKNDAQHYIYVLFIIYYIYYYIYSVGPLFTLTLPWF